MYLPNTGNIVYLPYYINEWIEHYADNCHISSAIAIDDDGDDIDNELFSQNIDRWKCYALIPASNFFRGSQFCKHPIFQEQDLKLQITLVQNLNLFYLKFKIFILIIYKINKYLKWGKSSNLHLYYRNFTPLQKSCNKFSVNTDFKYLFILYIINAKILNFI